MQRRRFLHQTGLSAAAILCCRSNLLAATAATRFKLGITTDEVSQDLEAALKFAQEFGLEWVEIRNVWNRYITETSLEDVKRVKALLNEYRIRVSVFDTSLYKCALPGTTPAKNQKDDYPYAEQEALLKRALERSEILGTRFIRIFSFWRVADLESVRDRVVEHLHKAANLAKAADRVLLVENVGGATAETSAETARVLKAVPSANLGFLWDPNNAYCAAEKPIPDGYAQLDKKRLHHVHLRDAARDPQTGRCQWLPVGKGEVDNLRILRALLKDGYQGTLNLETHYERPDKNKELASRESLKGLLEVIEKV